MFQVLDMEEEQYHPRFNRSQQSATTEEVKTETANGNGTDTDANKTENGAAA